MNIEKMEAILQEMQAAKFEDLATEILVKKWAERLSAAITDHLLAELGSGGLVAAVDLSEAPGGHEWEDADS